LSGRSTGRKLAILSYCANDRKIGISTLLCHEIEVLRHLIIGSVICNLLLVSFINLDSYPMRLLTIRKIPGICFTVGGLQNTRTGFSSGIEQCFNGTTYRIISQLTLFGAVFSSLLYMFLVTASAPDSIIVTSVLSLSRGMSIVLICIFVIWLWFRYLSHTTLFDAEHNMDRHEDETRYTKPLLSPWMDLLVILICVIPLVLQTDSIALSLHLMSPETRKWLAMYWVPVLLPIDRHVKAIRLIHNDQIDDSLDLSLGFAITLCLFVGPLLVILFWCLGDGFTLQFDLYGTVAYLLSVSLMAYVVADGKSNWLEGVELLVL